jgi:hypothetical protein
MKTKGPFPTSKGNLATNKLSKLQKWILVAALRNREAGQGIGITSSSTNHAADLSLAEIKANYYGFTTIKKEIDTSWNFHAADIPNYGAVSASISRSVSNLQQRALVQIFDGRNWRAVRLTETGMKTAKSLASKTNTTQFNDHLPRKHRAANRISVVSLTPD